MYNCNQLPSGAMIRQGLLWLQSIDALENQNACSADDVEAVLLWQEPRRSSKVFLGGMYILVCLRQLVLGTFLSCSQVSGSSSAGGSADLHYSCFALGTTEAKHFWPSGLTAHAVWAETCFSTGSSHSLTRCRCGTLAALYSCSWRSSSAALRQLHLCGIAIISKGAPEGAGTASTS